MWKRTQTLADKVLVAVVVLVVVVRPIVTGLLPQCSATRSTPACIAIRCDLFDKSDHTVVVVVVVVCHSSNETARGI